MRKIFKNVVAMAAATILSANMAGALSAYAEETPISDEREIVMIGDYECWTENGQYYTEVNGEICGVINLDELEWTPEDAPVGRQSEVDISDGSVYKGKIDISNGDDVTPIFIGYNYVASEAGENKNFKLTYAIKAPFIFPNYYNVGIHVYSPLQGQWLYSNRRLFFNSFAQTDYLYSGGYGEAPTKIYLEFFKEGSDGESTVGYSFFTTDKE